MKITAKFQRDPVTIRIEYAQKTVSTIDQYFTVLPRGKKNETLYSLIEFYKPGAAIVFCNTKKMVDELVEQLNEHHFSARGLHGDMRQNERTQVIGEFRNHRFQLLIATDVVARGIDIDDVALIINYDLPQENEYYVHRIGRTGRAGKSGLAVSLVQNGAQLRQINEIARYANCRIEKLAIPTKKQILQSNTDVLCGEIRDFLAGETSEKYAAAVSSLLTDGVTAEQLACGLFAMLMKQRSDYDETAEDVGALSVEQLRPEPVQKRERTVAKKRPRGESGSFQRKNRENSENMATIKISIGKKDNVAPNHILGAAAGESGLPGKVFGAIQIDMTPDLHRLLLGFFFFAADIRNHVIQNLRPAFKRLSCAGNCLIGAGENLCHIQIHQRLNSGNIALQRAVGFHGDKAALCAEAFALMIDHADVIGVDLRHHHRNIRRGAVSAVVGNNGALFLCVGFLKRPDLFFFHIDGTEDEIHHRSDAFDVLFCVEQNHARFCGTEIILHRRMSAAFLRMSARTAFCRGQKRALRGLACRS